MRESPAVRATTASTVLSRLQRDAGRWVHRPGRALPQRRPMNDVRALGGVMHDKWANHALRDLIMVQRRRPLVRPRQPHAAHRRSRAHAPSPRASRPGRPYRVRTSLPRSHLIGLTTVDVYHGVRCSIAGCPGHVLISMILGSTAPIAVEHGSPPRQRCRRPWGSRARASVRQSSADRYRRGHVARGTASEADHRSGASYGAPLRLCRRFSTT
jgi:hypothetical protein